MSNASTASACETQDTPSLDIFSSCANTLIVGGTAVRIVRPVVGEPLPMVMAQTL